MQAALNLRLEFSGRGQGAAIGPVNILDGVIRPHRLPLQGNQCSFSGHKNSGCEAGDYKENATPYLSHPIFPVGTKAYHCANFIQRTPS